jgi:hypothetical protein
MPLLSEIPWQPVRPKRRWAAWAIAVVAGSMGVLALVSRGVLPEPEVRLAKPSTVTSTGQVEPREAPTRVTKPDEQPPVLKSEPERFPRAPSAYDGLRRELLDAP